MNTLRRAMMNVVKQIGVDPDMPSYVYTEDNFHVTITRQENNFLLKYTKPVNQTIVCKTAAGVWIDIAQKKGFIP